MKDARFIELVNLYIDRQISPAETAELEAELQANARRRQIYQQYCRMHRATKLVYESFRANAEQPAGATTGEPAPIARFEEGLLRKRRHRARWLYASGSLAAAACFAAVMAIRTGQFSATTTAATPPTLPGVAVAHTPAAKPPADPAASAANKPKTEYIALFGNSDGAQDYAALLNTLRQEQQRVLSPDHAQLPRESLFDDGVFGAKPVFTSESRSIYPAKPKADNQQGAEFTAFQFQR
jgi:anti-sigma factor RsiW